MQCPSKNVGIGYKMTKEEIKLHLGKYVQIAFTLYSRKHKVTTWFELYGHIIKVEDKNILFKDNFRHEFIVSNTRIVKIEAQKRRRKLKKKR